MATRAEVSVAINRPVEEVFAFVSVPENNPRWQKGVIEVERLSAKLTGLGATGRFRRKLLGREIAGTAEVIEYEPSRTFAYRGTAGPLSFKLRYTFQFLGDRTRLNLVVEGESQGFFGLVGPLLTRRLREQYQSHLDDLKNLLESEH
jgi:uncharacterized membrane protein